MARLSQEAGYDDTLCLEQCLVIRPLTYGVGIVNFGTRSWSKTTALL